MNLYLIEQGQNTGFDTFSSAVVCAKTTDAARDIHPGGSWLTDSWCDMPSQVTVTYLGRAAKTVKPGVICAAFHAG